MGAAVKQIAIGAAIIGVSLIPGVGPALGTALYSALVGVGISVTLGGVATAIRKPGSGTIKDNPQGRLLTVRQPAASRRVGYGEYRTGGILTFANHTGLRIAPTDQNQLVITIAGHGISDWNTFFGGTRIGMRFDDEVPEINEFGIGVGSWAGKVFVQIKMGYDGDEAFPSLLSDSLGLWTADHRQRGCAAAYVRVNYSETLYPNGIPNITFLVKGKPVFDPRLDSPKDVETVTGGTEAESEGTWGIDLVDGNNFSLQGTALTITATGHGFAGGEVVRILNGQIFKLAYSNNAALVIADYLMDPWVGMGVPWAKIRESVLLAAANVCDEEIELDEASPPTTEFRYAINGTFETSEQHGEILAQMANAMAGHVTYIGGEWHIIPGAFRLPVMELTDRHVVAPMQVQTKRSKRDLVNGVKGTFPSALHNYIETDFPAIPGATYLAEDQGIRVWKDIFLPFTTSPTACQRIAEIELNRNRRQISVQMTCSMSAYELQPGDVVEFTHSRYSWALETFEVSEVGLGQNEDGAMVVTLQLVQTDVDVYGFAVDDYGNLIDPDLLDLLNRTVPFGWSPGLVHRPDTLVEQLRARTDYSFIVGQQYRVNADGSISPQFRIDGFLPPNLFSQEISRPRTKTLTALTAASGGFIDGGQRYYIAVAALDQVVSGSPPVEDIGRITALSEIAAVDVPAASPETNTNTVTLTDLRWHSDTMGWVLFFGTDKFRLSSQASTGSASGVSGTCTVTGPNEQPTSITFKGFNVPAQIPKGYFEHLRGAPDHRFEHLRFKAYRCTHLGIWGGRVIATGGAGSPIGEPYTITLNPSPDFTVNVLAGRYISLMGIRGSTFDKTENSGMPLAEFLIESNTGDTVTLATGQANPADHGFELGAVVVVRTKATAVGVEDSRNYIEDTGFGEGGQDLGDNDPSVGGGDDSLQGDILRIIGGTGRGTKALIAGNDVALGRIYIEGEWDATPDTASVFIVCKAIPSIQHDTDILAAQQLESIVSLKIPAPMNTAGEQYLIFAHSVSPQGKESPEASSPYREIFVFGGAEAGRLVATDTIAGIDDAVFRVDATSGPVGIMLPAPDLMPGRIFHITKVDASANAVTIFTEDGSDINDVISIELTEQWETAFLQAYDDSYTGL